MGPPGLDTVALTNRLDDWDMSQAARDHLDALKLAGLVRHYESDTRKRWQVKDPFLGVDFAVSEVWGRGTWPEYWARVEVSLPKYLHGHNVYPATVEDFRFFCKALDQSEVCPCPLSWTQANVSRLDMVQDIERARPSEWIAALRTMPAPFTRMTPAIYPTSVYWYNKTHSLRVYDKYAECAIDAAVGRVRIEYEARKPRLRQIGVHYASDVWEVVLLEQVGNLAASLIAIGDGPQDIAIDVYRQALNKGCTQRQAMLVMATSLLESAGIPVESRWTRDQARKVREQDAGSR